VCISIIPSIRTMAAPITVTPKGMKVMYLAANRR